MPRRLVSVLIVAFAALAPAHASASLPKAKPLKRLGLRVTWPVKRDVTLLAPGAKVTVLVKRTRRLAHPPAVRVALQDFDSEKTLARKTLRKGRATFTLPDTAGANVYVLSLRVRRLRYSSQLATEKAIDIVPPIVAPVVAEEPGPPVVAVTASGPTGPTGTSDPAGSDCENAGSTAGTLAVAAASTTPGGDVGYTVTNTGTACVFTTLGGNQWQREVDGSWDAIAPQPSQTRPYGELALEPGQSHALTATAGENFPDGRYRILKTLSAGNGSGSVTVMAELDITGAMPAAAATMTLAPAHAPVQPGDGVAYKVLNRGQATLVGGAAYEWDRQVGGEWVQENPRQAFPADAFTLPAGGEDDGTATTQTTFPPGHYRLVRRYESEADDATLTVMAELDIA